MVTTEAALAGKRVIRPHEGPQSAFLASSADVCVYGGSAGGGKTFALLMEAARHVANPDWHPVLFRRTFPEIRMAGGMWDESMKLYPYIGGRPRENDLEWVFQSGATVRFAHMQHEMDKLRWMGAQIPMIGFDQMETFQASQFWYLMSRNRSVSGIRPYVRGTVNPDADSWVKGLLAPWVDEEDPDYPWPSDKLRWFTRDGDDVVWVTEDWRDPDGQPARTMQFIPATIYDNPTLLAANPEYLGALRTLPLLERERLLHGNWLIRADGNLFKREWFKIIEELPAGMRRQCRYWDLASTEEDGKNDPDYTAGALLYLGHEGPWRGKWVIAHIDRFRGSPATVDARVLQRAQMDGRIVTVGLEEEAGASGKRTTADFRTRLLVGYDVQSIRPTGSKEWRWRPLSSAAEAGNVYLLRGDWNDAFLAEAQRAGSRAQHDDQLDAVCGAMEVIVAGGVPAAGISAPGSRPRPGQTGWGPRRGFDRGAHARRPGPMSRAGNTRRRAR